MNSGGWRTVTTKDRINRALPDKYRVWSRRVGSGRDRTSEWWLYEFDADRGMRAIIQFRDHMSFIPSDRPLTIGDLIHYPAR